jgi:hypothetical protein
MHRRRLLVLTALATAALAMAGCSSVASLSPTPVPSPPASPTAPGTTYPLGGTAWVEMAAPGGGTELVGASVREIAELDPADIEGFLDDPDLAVTTPYAIVVQYDWTPASDFDTQSRAVPILPITENGEIAQWLSRDIGNVAMGDADACGKTFDPPADGTVIGCFVGLSTGGRPIIGAVYNGTSRADFALDQTHPYARMPITWRR